MWPSESAGDSFTLQILNTNNNVHSYKTSLFAFFHQTVKSGDGQQHKQPVLKSSSNKFMLNKPKWNIQTPEKIHFDSVW